MHSVSQLQGEYREGRLGVERQMRSYKDDEIESDEVVGIRTCFLKLWSRSNPNYRGCDGLILLADQISRYTEIHLQ